MKKSNMQAKRILSLLLTLVMLLSMLPTSVAANPAPEYKFGPSGTSTEAALIPGIYDLTVQMKKADAPDKNSMAADCIKGSTLEVMNNGDAYVNIELGPKTILVITAYASDWKIYQEHKIPSALTAADIVSQDKGGNVTEIRFKLPYANWDGIFAHMTITAINKQQDCFLKMLFHQAAHNNAKEAAKIDAMIAALGEVSLASEAAITEARNSYDWLVADSRKLVQNLAALEGAEARLQELKDAAQAETDQAAAAAVEAKIAAIGEVTLESEPAITEARAAYTALTDLQKTLVRNLAVLDAAEARLAELKKPAPAPTLAEGSYTVPIKSLTSGAPIPAVAAEFAKAFGTEMRLDVDAAGKMTATIIPQHMLVNVNGNYHCNILKVRSAAGEAAYPALKTELVTPTFGKPDVTGNIQCPAKAVVVLPAADAQGAYALEVTADFMNSLNGDINADHWMDVTLTLDLANAQPIQPAGPTYEFGTSKTVLKPGKYDLPVALMHASKHEQPSMAASAVLGGSLEVLEDGSAFVNVKLGPVTVGTMTGWSSQWQIYNEYDINSVKTPAEVVSRDAEQHDTEIRFQLPYTDQDGVYASMFVEVMSLCPDALLALDFAKAVPEGTKPETVTGTMKVVMTHETKPNPSMCDALFADRAAVEITGDTAVVKLMVVKPVPAFVEEGVDGTVKNVIVTYNGQEYPAESDITSKPMMTAKQDSQLFGLEKGKQYPAQVLTLTLPAAALKEQYLVTTAFVNVVMNTDIAMRMGLSDRSWEETKPDPQPEPQPEVKTGKAEVSFGGSKAYDVQADVTVLDGRITKVVLTHSAENDHPDSVSYANDAKAMAEKFKDLSATDKTNIEAVDGVTGATITSDAYREAVLKALDLYQPPKPADFTFGSANIRLEPGTYVLPIRLRNADKHGDDSNAVAAFPATGRLTVAENGTATLTSEFKPVTIGPITDMAYDVKVYQADSYQTGTPVVDAAILETAIKPENMPGAGKEVPTKISFTIPNNDWDGVYVNFTVDAMGPGYPDAWLQLDYAKAVAPGPEKHVQGSAKVDQFGKYTIHTDITVQDGVITNVAVTADHFISENHDSTNLMKIDQVTKALKSAWNGMAPIQENAEQIFKVIMNPQSPDDVIDTVSGATYSAKAVRDAVMSAFDLKYQDEIINVPESVEPGIYEVEIGYYSDVVWHSLVEKPKSKATLTVNADKTMVLDFETKSGTEKEPLYILGFNGIYPNNDKKQALTTEGTNAVMGLSSNDYEDENFAKGTQVVNHLTFPLQGGLSMTYTTNCYLYVPAMKRLNGELSGVVFENGKFNVDVFAKIYWDGMKKIGDVPAELADGYYTAAVTMKHESKDQSSMCDIMFDAAAGIRVKGDDAILKLLAANPVPGFPDQGADGTVKNMVVTIDGRQYVAESALNTGAKMTAKDDSPIFGFVRGEEYSAQVLTVTLPKRAITEGALLNSSAYVNVVMMTDVNFRIHLSDIRTDTNPAPDPEPEKPVNPVSIKRLEDGGVGLQAEIATTNQTGYFLIQVTSAEKKNSIYVVAVKNTENGVMEISYEKGGTVTVWQTADKPELIAPAPNAGGKLLGSAVL